MLRPALLSMLCVFGFSSVAHAVVGQNDAPVLDNTRAPQLVTEFVNAGAPVGAVGTPVRLLVDFASPSGQLDNITDADIAEGESSAQLGIAITAAAVTNGSWWFSTNNGGTWTALGAVTNTSARLLAADAQTRIYFAPDAAFAGTASITFRAWDLATGTNGGTATTATNGGTTAFSLATDTAALDVIGNIAVRSSSQAGLASTTVLTLGRPTGVVSGDLMLGTIAIAAGSTTTITPPSGWTLVRRTDNASAMGMATYYKIAGGSEPAFYSWTFPAAVDCAGGNIAYSNASNTDPIHVESGQANASSLSQAAPSVTTTVGRTMVTTFHAFASSATWTPPPGMTEAIDVNSAGVTGSAGVSLSGNTSFLLAPGASGTRTATASNSADLGAGHTLAIRPVNSAPLLDATKTPVMVAKGEDDAPPVGAVGTLVASLVDQAGVAGGVDNLIDADSGALDGIALTGANSANGTWYYTLDGSSWSLLPAVSDAAAFLLEADGDNALYFRPSANFNGTIPDAITFRAWDRTAGTGGTTANATTNGGTTAFSTASDVADLVVAGVNDPPTATNLSAAETYTEDTSLNLVDIVAADIDNANVTATLTLSNPGAGSLNTSTSGAVTSTYVPATGVWTASGAIANVNTLLAGVTFTPAANFNASFTIATSVSDGSASVTGSKAMTGVAVNDAPTATNLSAAETYTEDVSLNLVNIVASDIDSPNLTATLTLSNTSAGSLTTATSGSVTSTYSAGTGVWTASGLVANVNTLLAGVSFVPAANFNSNFTMLTSVSDGALSVTGSKTMTGVAVNDAPTATNLSTNENYTEDVPLNLTDIVVADVDGTFAVATLTLTNPTAGTLNTATVGSTSSTYNPGTGVWNAGGPITEINALLAGLTFTPAANFNLNVTMTTSVTDGIAAPLTGSKLLTGIAVDDQPTATNLSAAETYTEDTPLDLTDIVVSDVDNVTTSATLTLSSPAAGTLSTGTSGAVTSTYNAGTGVWSASGQIPDVNALLAGVVFTPAANFNSNFTITTSVADGASSAVTGSKAMTGTPVNDPPVATNLSAAETYTEDAPLNLVNIVISDDNPNVTATLTVSNTTAGTLTTGTSGSVTSTYVNGVWTASGPIANVNTLLANVVFTPTANFTTNFTIATNVSDGTLSVSGSKDMTGVAVNDPPTATNLSAGETYTEDTPLDLQDIVVSDIDSPNVTATLTLSNPGFGSLSTGTSGFVTSTYNAGTGVWSASGNTAAVNALLAGVVFTPAANVNSTFNIATSVSDGSLATTGSKLMQGVAVNDAPTATNLSAPETYTEDTALNLVDIVVSDVDSPNATVTLTVSPASAGALNTATSGSVTSTYNAGTGVWTASGAIASVNTLLAGLTCTPATNFNGAFSIGTSVTDGASPAVTGAKPMTGVAVNDPPTATNLSANETYFEDTQLNPVDIVVADVDNTSLTMTLTLSNPSAGALTTGTSGAVTSTYDANTGVWTASGPIANVNALLVGLRFNPAANFNSNFTIATSVSDGLAATNGSKVMSGVGIADPPTATNLSSPETYFEDTPLDFADIVVSDVDSPNVTATLTLAFHGAGTLSTGTSGAVTSTYDPNSGVWSASGAIADVNALLAALVFTPAPNSFLNATLTTSVTDGTTSPIGGTKPLTGVAVDDPPTATNLSAGETYTEDTPLNLIDIVVADVDDQFQTNATLTLSNPAAGSLNTGTVGITTSTFNPATGVWSATGSAGNVTALLAGLVFTPAPDFNGTFSIATSVSDGIAAPLTGSKPMVGIPVNDAPLATNLSAAESYNEDSPHDLADIVVSDVDSPNATATLTLSNPAVGALSTATSGAVTSTYNAGTGAWTAAGAIPDVNALLAAVAFTPAPNVTTPFTIATSVSDGVAAPLTGVKAMTGVAVDDAPTATNLSQPETYTEDVALNLADVVASDIDSPSLTATLTLSTAAAGALSTGTSGAVTSTYDSGNGAWTASGPTADVNALLAAIVFTPAANYNANFTIATSVSDGVAAPATGSKPMTGVAVNDAPVLGPGVLAGTQALGSIFAGQFADVDAGATLAGVAVVSNSADAGTQGAWQYSSNAGVDWSAVGSVDDATGALALSASTLLRFVPVSGFVGNPDSLLVRALDDTYAGGFSNETRVTLDVTGNGGSSPIAQATSVLSTTVNGVIGLPHEDLPLAFALESARPNPSAGAFGIGFALPTPSHVTAALVSAGGRVVARLADADYPAGRHRLAWSGSVSAGVYFVRFIAAGHTLVRRVVLLR